MQSERSLLIVDEDTDLLEMLSRRLLRRGYHVTTVRHPRQALAAASEHEFQLAILDDTLPEMDGFELMAKLKMQAADLRVLILSSGAEAADCGQVVHRGADACIAKPPRLDDLESAIEVALRPHDPPPSTDGG